uniref:Heme-binding protein 1 n=1 Tax=Myripristis murdjan TaxID=586833 RepID=A0A668AWU2_9TELE
MLLSPNCLYVCVRIYISGFVGFLLVLTSESMQNNLFSNLCTETEECLLYDLVCENENYEVRHYSSVKWVSTDEEAFFMDTAIMTAFRRLFKYITGSNKNGEKIEMTAPVVIKIDDSKKQFWQSKVYTMSFLLPSEHQENPPQPTDDKVYFQTMPEMKMYVKSYGGWMMSLTDKINADRLTNQLDAVGAQYKQDHHYAVGYNSPMALRKHNEVWFVVEGEPLCQPVMSDGPLVP